MREFTTQLPRTGDFYRPGNRTKRHKEKDQVDKTKDLVALPGLEPGLFALRGPFGVVLQGLRRWCRTCNQSVLTSLSWRLAACPCLHRLAPKNQLYRYRSVTGFLSQWRAALRTPEIDRLFMSYPFSNDPVDAGGSGRVN